MQEVCHKLVLIINNLIPGYHSAYSGQFCEKDRDGCAEESCYNGVQCYDIPAPGVGRRCGPCPLGYTGDGITCNGVWKNMILYQSVFNVICSYDS